MSLSHVVIRVVEDASELGGNFDNIEPIPCHEEFPVSSCLLSSGSLSSLITASRPFEACAYLREFSVSIGNSNTFIL